MAETAPIVRSVEVGAPAERIFRLLTEPEELVRWWPDVAELEPRVGGRVRMEFRGGESVVTGEVTRYEPPRALAFTWVRAERPEATTAIELTVTVVDDERCRVEVVHSGWERAPELRPMHDQGWAHFLECLVALAEEREFDKDLSTQGGDMNDRMIEITKTIDASPERVFTALTDADELVRWFPSSADSDARSGGPFEYRFEFPEEPERNHTYGGAYHDVVPSERVSYPWSGKLGETRVDVELRAAGEGTDVTLRHTGWGEGEEWEESLAMHREGWGFFLDNLRAYLERGEDRRADVLGMRTAATV